LGRFRVKIDRGANKNILVDSTVGNSEIAVIKDEIFQQHHFTRKSVKGQQIPEYFAFKGVSSSRLESSNFIAYQVSGFLPFEFEVMYESNSLADEYKEKYGVAPKELKGAEFEQLLAKWHNSFQNKFENLFKLREKNVASNAILMAQAALSNMLGGIGFFHGESLVRSMVAKEPTLYWESNLYTAVPSRSFFPRGFLWDEGFHNILIQKWDPEITKDIVAHWLDLMNVEGWIPR
jgi:mannosyl-oligosaccharide glucosidase